MTIAGDILILAALAYVAQEAVNTHGWLMPGEMLDGLGLAETTPGPLILVLQFVGRFFQALLGLPLEDLSMKAASVAE